MKPDTETIITNNLTKEFVKNIPVISDISLRVKRGELFCLVGANGAGKTTLIKMLCNLILPTRGEIFINGHNISSDFKKVPATIGLVTGDERSFYWRLTGKQNMEFFARLYNIPEGIINTRIEELFAVLEIGEPDKKFQAYSSGIKQRMSIARALLNNPDTVFIDELTKNLDYTSASHIRHFIRETLVNGQGKTIFFSTNQLYEAEELADRIAFISRGKIVGTGRLDELRESLGTEGATVKQVYEFFMQK